MTTDISIVRWDPSQNNGQDYIDEYEYDGGNSSSRLFERSRIKALAGNYRYIYFTSFHFLSLSRSLNDFYLQFSYFFFTEERETVQKKTFTKWVNSHLVRVNCRINDLYVDMRDGKNLIKLLEILSGERLPRPTKGKMRIHCLENVDKALQFLREQRVHLENIGSHDVTVCFCKNYF